MRDGPIRLKFATEETLDLSIDEARALARSLWHLGLSSPGATSSAAKLSHVLGSPALRQVVDFDEREAKAVRSVLEAPAPDGATAI